jgi:hypothetical protein
MKRSNVFAKLDSAFTQSMALVFRRRARIRMHKEITREYVYANLILSNSDLIVSHPSARILMLEDKMTEFVFAIRVSNNIKAQVSA